MKKKIVSKKGKSKKVKAAKSVKRTRVHPLKKWLLQRPLLRQRDFAAIVGTTQPHISQIASGKTTPGARLAVRISKKTKIPLSKLV